MSTESTTSAPTKKYLVKSREGVWAICTALVSKSNKLGHLPQAVIYAAHSVFQVLDDQWNMEEVKTLPTEVKYPVDLTQVPTANRLMGELAEVIPALGLAALHREDTGTKPAVFSFAYEDVDSGFYVGADLRSFMSVKRVKLVTLQAN